MPVPKKRVSRARRDKRRANHDKMKAPATATCPKCGAAREPYAMCPSCGFYRDRVVKEMGEEKAAEAK